MHAMAAVTDVGGQVNWPPGDVMAPRSVMSVVEALEGRVDAVDRDTLIAVVEADFRRYDGARIKDFVPVLVERDVRAQLLRLRG